MPLAFSDFAVKIKGREMGDDFRRAVSLIVVDLDLTQPSMFTIVLRDTPTQTGKMTWTDSSQFDIGNEVEISAVSFASEGSRPQPQLLMKGEIVGLEPDFGAQGEVSLHIRGFDKMHRLTRGRKSRTFLKQSDDAIAKKIAGEAGLAVAADATSITHDYVYQHNQTDLEFLRLRAQRIGYRLFFAQDKLQFKKADVTLGDGPELKWGEELLRFQTRMSSAQQADTVKVQGWDVKQKKAVTGTATPSAPGHQGGISQAGGAAAKRAFGKAETVVADVPVTTQAEADQIAKGQAAALSAEFVQVEGVCWGNPKVQPGKVITITDVGKRFSGKYLVTAAQHRLSTGSGHGYETTFYSTGYEPYTVTHLLGLNPGNLTDDLPGVGVGVVTNVKDPDGLGRVKVSLPWYGENAETHWARIASPMAGAERGFLCLPEVNDEVLVAFEHGDVRYPYVLGSLWNGLDKPPIATDEAVGGDGKVNQRALKTRAGHLILLDDKEGAEKITIKDKTQNHEITIDSSAKTLTIKMASNEIVLDASGNKLTVKTGNGGLAMETQGAVSIKSSTGEVKLEGMTITLQASTGLTLKNNAGAQMAMNGPTVNINNGALEVM